MTDNMPVLREQPPTVAPFLDTVDSHIVQVQYHDRYDVVMEIQYWLLMVEDAPNNEFLATKFSVPVTTETDL